MSSSKYGSAWFVAAVAAFLAAVYAAVALLLGSDLANARDDAALLLFGAVGLFALVGWWWDRSTICAVHAESEAPEEVDVVKPHPRIGYHIVQQVPALEPMALGLLHHHERYDGRGYPAGLRGEEIPGGAPFGERRNTNAAGDCSLGAPFAAKKQRLGGPMQDVRASSTAQGPRRSCALRRQQAPWHLGIKVDSHLRDARVEAA